MTYKVGRCLLLLRLKETGMTQKDLATKMNVTIQQINKYALNKQKMSLEVARNVAAILHCDITDLYEWDVKAGKEE